MEYCKGLFDLVKTSCEKASLQRIEHLEEFQDSTDSNDPFEVVYGELERDTTNPIMLCSNSLPPPRREF